MFAAADQAADARQRQKAANNANQELVALVQGNSSCDEELLQGRLKSFGVAWCNSLDSNGRYLVRFLTHDGLEAAVKALHGSSWLGQPFSVEPLSVGQLQPAGQESGLTPRADSIPIMHLAEDYFSAMLQDEQQQQDEQEQEARSTQQQSKAASAFEVSALQDLEPCDAECIPTAVADSSILGRLEDDPLSNDASPVQSFTSNTSTCQLWSQRSIGAVARKDLAKFAAMQHMAQQHSCNSPTQASLLAAGHHVLGLGSTWSSAHSVHSSSSLASLALTAAGGSSIFQDGVRRSSSPSGQLQGHSSLPCAPTATTPRSPFHAAGDAGGFGSGLQQPQQQLNLTRSGSAGQTSNLTLNLPLELGLGDSASALADEEVMRVHNMAAARQQQQQQGTAQSCPLTIRTGPQHGSGLASSLPNFAGLLSSYGSEGASSPLGGQPLSTEGSGGFLAASASAAAGGSSRFAGGAGGSFGSGNGLGAEAGAGYPGSPHGLGLVPPPPPPPPQGQPGTPGTPPGGLLGQQPPPPPPPGGSRTPPPPALDSYSGSPYEGAGRTGAISPVQPAPPPRAITPGATWQGPGSGNCSPRLGGLSQPQSPSNGYRAPPRSAGLRGFQHGMSNLGQHSGSYDSYGSQPPLYGRVGSPVMGPRAHSPCGVPPPPPPSTHVPPGYLAAATAAATACGSHVSPAPSPPPPAGLGPRPGSTCDPSGAPNAPGSNVSTPSGRAGTAAADSQKGAAKEQQDPGANGSSGGREAAPEASGARQAATDAKNCRKQQQQQQQQQQQLKADGVLFVEELLLLLKQPGATAGNPFLANLTDLLDCALSASQAGAAAAEAAGGTGSGKGSGAPSRSSSGHNSRRTSNDEQKSAAAAAAAAAAAVLAANGSAKVPLLPMAAITESLNRGAGAGSSSNTPRTARSSTGGSRDNSRGGARRGAGSAKQVPVDAAAFLGMLQEAAAPLLAAAAAAAVTQRFSNAGMSGNGRRPGQQRGSSGGYEEACGGISSRGQSQGGDPRSSKAGGLRGSTVGLGAGSNSSSSTAQPGGTEAGASAAEGALSSSGGSGDLSTLPLNLLLRHSLAGGLSKGGSGPQGSQLLFPLHPRTTTHSSCGGGTAPGTPLGTPMLLVPQTVPELLSTRAALLRLLLSAHAFVHGPVYARMASRLSGIEELYDSMHEDPVVVKRRKCRDMAAMRDVIKRDTAFSQAVSQVSSMRNHIYSLSRKVLIGFGHMESLPIDLLLGGLTTELAAILAEPCDPQQLGQTAVGSSSSGSGSSSGTAQATPGESRTSNASSAGTAAQAAGGSGDSAAAATAAAAADTGGIVLPQHVADFFTAALPLPKLALLVFVEFVPVDPAPCSTSLPPSGLGAPDAAWTPSVSGSGSASHGGGSRGSQQHNGGHSSRDHCRSSNEHAADSHSHGGGYQHHQQGGNGNGTPRNRNGHHARWGHGRDRDMGHSNGGGRMRDSNGGGNSHPNTPRRGSRGGNYSNGGASIGGAGSGQQQDGGKRNSSRRSGHGGFDLVAEAAALEAAASAAAPLVAAAVCDLPPGNRRQGSNAGSSS